MEQDIGELGRRLLAAAQQREPITLSPQWWQGHLLSWATNDPEFRVKLLRFVDVLPTLRSAAAVADCAYERADSDTAIAATAA